MKKRKLSSILKELDDISKTVTGRDIPSWTKQAWDELRQTRNQSQVAEPAAEDPYEVLELDPNCIPSEIIYRYRQLAKKYHPDNRETGDEAIFKKVTEAYEQISKERGIK